MNEAIFDLPSFAKAPSCQVGQQLFDLHENPKHIFFVELATFPVVQANSWEIAEAKRTIFMTVQIIGHIIQGLHQLFLTAFLGILFHGVETASDRDQGNRDDDE